MRLGHCFWNGINVHSDTFKSMQMSVHQTTEQYQVTYQGHKRKEQVSDWFQTFIKLHKKNCEIETYEKPMIQCKIAMKQWMVFLFRVTD